MLKTLSESEIEIVRKSIVEVVKELDWDLQTRIGVDLERIQEILAAWPHVDDTDDDSDTCLVINNAMNDLLHGIGLRDEKIRARLGYSREQLLSVYEKWAVSRGWKNTRVR